MISKKIIEFLEDNEFLAVATCGQDMQPNVSAKFLLKVIGDCIYLGDYNIDRTWSNINFNPKVSLFSMDLDTLEGYQINGKAGMLDEGKIYESLIEEFNSRKINFSTKRVIESVQKEKACKQFETIFPETVIIYRIKVEEIIALKPTGQLKRQRV
ncbi:MAG: pyridoxamine 5'-phosphate oxidase family protein [Candidatus Omnitrophica bacterium]|nr:pyridoxamine 5'-phosphate oxidase family protein [Candidatus Omnitrophota bacterium]